MCKPKNFCENNKDLSKPFIYYEPDFDPRSSLDTLVVLYDLECERFLGSLYSMLYFIGAIVGSFLLPWLSDAFGRRSIYLTSLVFSIIMTLVQLVLPRHQRWAWIVFVVTMFFQGILSDGRKSMGFAYMVELAPKKWSNLLGTMFNISDYPLINILITIYFLNNKNTIGTTYISLGYSIVTLVVVWLVVPESPKWLYGKEKYNDLFIVLNFMARMNGKVLPDNSPIFLLVPEDHANDVHILIEEYDETGRGSEFFNAMMG